MWTIMWTENSQDRWDRLFFFAPRVEFHALEAMDFAQKKG